jgi:membrane protease YdiL (CAAX protease family)
VRAGPVFLAEMLSPIAANPIYWGAPLFAAIVYGSIYGPKLALVAVFLVGIPVIGAAACLGKALEIGVTLRFPPRSRGAMIGIMSWLGYASMMLFFVGLFVVPKIVFLLGNFLSVLTLIPWPWLGLFLGQQSSGSFSFLQGVVSCWILSCILIGFGVWFSVWGANLGLAGRVGAADAAPRRPPPGSIRFGKEPLYRKEFLWFVRDRSAIVQTILIPLTVAGFQVFNMRGLLSQAQGAWNYLCGVGILFGTYFLWVLGPKSLSSEGTALWISLTWPRGLESLLKAKAWLWSLLSSAMVFLVLGYAAFVYPSDIWKIAIIGAAWFFFGRSMAEKTVTLVTVTAESGERQRIPWGRRGAAQLGMLTFAIGVFTQQWHIAIMGIVYSYITAAAMWQNFRARLPYLYDPWSERLPPPPTLMHAMIAISILVEAGAVLTGIMLVIAGRENLAIAQAVSYGICAVAVSVGMWNFLSHRGVPNEEVWRWAPVAPSTNKSAWSRLSEGRGAFLLALIAGAIGGLALGLFAHGYIAILSHIPRTAELIRKSREQLTNVPNLRLSYGVMAVLFAPFAEEYLFRGLLFRALDREWGGWRAVVGSAAFFAVYHPALSWVPVFMLGASNALLFKKTGRLLPAVVLHMIYNAVVLT